MPKYHIWTIGCQMNKADSEYVARFLEQAGYSPAASLDEAALNNGLDLIFLLTPTSTTERIRLVVEKSRGFVYMVSLLGVTGARESLPSGLGDFVGRVRQETGKPLCVGFGISTPEQAQRVGQIADGVIVGSRLVQLVRDDRPPYERVRSFIQTLRTAIG